MVKKNGCRFRGLRVPLGTHTACVVNSCQGKVAGVLFRVNYSIHQHSLALDVIQVLDGINYFKSVIKVSQFPACVSLLSLSLSESKLMTGYIV